MLRSYQSDAISAIRAAYSDGAKRVCLSAPTGAGKTVIFADIARKAAEHGTRTAILVHRDALLTQATDKLRSARVRHSVIAPGHTFMGDYVTVASVHTLVRRLTRHHFGLLIIDEAHHAVSPTYQRILSAYPDAHVLGVTATPCRTDGKGLDGVFERLIAGPSIAELIADGYLVEPVAYGPAAPVSLAGVATRMGDYDQRQLAEIMDTKRVTGDAVAHYTRLAPGAPAIVFCVNVAHAEAVAAQFKAAGYRSAHVSGKMHVTEIRRRTAGLADGSVQVLTSCDLISEGFDAPAASVIISLRPTKSLALYIQQVGRGLRPTVTADTREARLAAIAASAKPHAIILDHAGNSFRFGLADEPREWSLQGRARRSSGPTAPPVRQCSKCYRCHRPAPACPECGHIYAVEVTSGPATRAGNLSKIDKAALARARQKEISMCKTYEDLKRLGAARGYKPAWAAIRWQARGAR